jgi:hypothetical protein
VRFGILGTGVVGKTIAVRLDGLGYDVIVGTRNPEEPLSRTDPDQYGNPPFGAWQEEHPEVRLARSPKRLPTATWLSMLRPVPSRWRR